MASLVGFHLIPLTVFLTVIFALKAQADEAQSQDYNFCSSTLKGDKRSYTADLNGLATISAALTSTQAKETSARIDGLIHGINDPVAKKRILRCQSDYGHATDAFGKAFSSASVRSNWDVISHVRDGYNNVVDCENIYTEGRVRLQ